MVRRGTAGNVAAAVQQLLRDAGFMVGGDEKNIPAPEGAEVIGKTTYVLYDYQITSQGVTNDGEYFYFSGNKNLGKADLETGEIFRITVNAIPDELEKMGFDTTGITGYVGDDTFNKIFQSKQLQDNAEYRNAL